MPGLIALPLKIFFRNKLIFDIRGFWPEEKVDRAGWSKKGFLYKFFKYLERKIINSSDAVIALTFESQEILIFISYLSFYILYNFL